LPGIVRLNGGRCNRTVPAAYSADAHLRLSLLSSSLPRRDYQSLRLVIFSLRLELPRCRRNVVFLKISGRIHYLWRAVDQDGDGLDILVQSRRDQKAAKKFFRRLLKGLRYVPRMTVTDKLKSYGAAKAAVIPSIKHRQDKGQNNRAENSHQPTRLRERVMRRFKSSGHAQRFLSAFGIIISHFRVGRHLYRASGYREVMKSRFAAWEEVVVAQAAA